MTIPQTNKELVEAAKEWRCFHCDEQFTDPTEAMEHFGDQLYDTPACQLTKDEKGLVGLLREAHFQLRRYQSEDSASYREFYSLGSAHSTALMREEEKGYARGLRDGRTEHPQPVTSELLEAAKEVLTGGNHLANFLIGKRGGGFATLYPPDTEPLKALELLGAGDAYDVWCCWAAIMKLRTALQSTPANVQEGGKP